MDFLTSAVRLFLGYRVRAIKRYAEEGDSLQRHALKMLVKGRPNLFYDWLDTKGKMGGQHKIPRLSGSRKYMDELLDMNSI